jgi:hypothetical protein
VGSSERRTRRTNMLSRPLHRDPHFLRFPSGGHEMCPQEKRNQKNDFSKFGTWPGERLGKIQVVFLLLSALCLARYFCVQFSLLPSDGQSAERVTSSTSKQTLMLDMHANCNVRVVSPENAGQTARVSKRCILTLGLAESDPYSCPTRPQYKFYRCETALMVDVFRHASFNGTNSWDCQSWTRPPLACATHERKPG